MNEQEGSVSSIDKEAIAVPADGETADKWTVMGIMAIASLWRPWTPAL
jgi:hypothetical protein